MQEMTSDTLKKKTEGLATEAFLSHCYNHFGDQLVLASSLGAEDQVLTHMALKIDPKARVFVLDTGRLNQETYTVMNETMNTYHMRYEVCFPDPVAVTEMVQEKGPNLFYESIENRKQCCHVRKVSPLQEKLKTAKAWITGLRRQQSVTRQQLERVEWDDGNQLIKLNPLADWTEDQIWDYIKTHKVPYNSLHDQGYPSIGCAPCTRAIKPGEDVRAGRWWWETPEQKECGLHMVDGKLVPIRDQDNDKGQNE